MKHTDTEILDFMEQHVTKVTSGDYVTFVVIIDAKRPAGTLRIAVRRAMDEEREREEKGAKP